MRKNAVKMISVFLAVLMLLWAVPFAVAVEAGEEEVVVVDPAKCEHVDENADNMCDICLSQIADAVVEAEEPTKEGMSVWSAIILGVVQGVAEFLPISSSGHLIIFQKFFGLSNNADNLFFNILLHIATLCAVFVAYWREIKGLIFEALFMVKIRKLPAGQSADLASRKMILFIVLGTLPLFVIVPFKDWIGNLEKYPIAVGAALLVTGTLLFISDRINRGNKEVKNTTLLDILLIGCAQALATVPGLSRSGTTISAGMARGFSREYAVRFSFLLSIPAILGAFVLEIVDAIQEGIVFEPVYLVGMVVAAVTGYLSICLLKFITRRSSFGAFCYYCWGAGLVTMILSLIFR